MSALGAPILAGLLPPRGALVGIVALLALAVLDRIPLRAYRPHQDDGHTPRRRRRRVRAQVRASGRADRQDAPPAVTLTRLDQPPAPRQLQARPDRTRPP